MLKKYNVDIAPIRDITALGSITLYGLFLLLFLSVQEYKLVLLLIFGLAISYIISISIRLIYFKNRPNKQKHNNWIERLDASSFPSIHASRIVFVAMVFIFKFNSVYTTLFWILVSLLVMYSRYHLKKHDWIDLSAGALLGILTYWLSTLIF